MYYVLNVAVAIVFMAYYVYLAFKPREQCSYDSVSKGKPQTENVGSIITAVFVVGFILHTINFTIHTFVEPCVRLMRFQDRRDSQRDSQDNG